jgi:lipoprotein-releasing system permease protein
MLIAIRNLWRSPWTTWVGLRYLKSKKNSKFLSLITLLSMLGVGVGVTSMITVLSVMDGFEDSLKKRLMSSDLHILITPKLDTPGLSGGFVPKDTLEKTSIPDTIKSNPVLAQQIEGLWPMVSTEAIMKIGRKISGVTFKGITPERLGRLKASFSEIAEPQMLVEHEGPNTIRLPGVFVGQELAYELGLIPGDQVTMISPTETEGPFESVPRLKRYVVEAIYKAGTPEQELETVYASDSDVRSFLRKADVVTQWELTVRDFDQAPAVADALRAAAPTLRVQDWVQLNSHLFASLRLERFAMSVALAFIILVASFNIVTTLTLMVLEKRKEISILKAMGAEHGQVAAIFLAEGLLIGLLGAVGGALLAFLICCILRRYEFIALPDIYYDRTLPVTFSLSYYTGVSLCAMVIVLGACLYPAKRAAHLNPLDGIRFG